MRCWEGAYMGPGSVWGCGYSIETDRAQCRDDLNWAMEQHAEERALSCLYEGGEFCGLWSDMTADSDDETPRWAWALLPETAEDLQHIESIIVPYGRKEQWKDVPV